MPLLFEDAAKVKDAIMVSQQKEIQKLYEGWAEDIADRAKFYSTKTNASAAVSERYYKELYAQMKAQSNELGKEIQGLITSNIYTIADSVVASNVNWLKEFGFSEDGLNAAFSYIPNDVVQRLVTGQIYQGGWNLSQRIWSDSQQTQKDVYQIMARGLAEQKSVYEIAKDLESYVKPSAKLSWNPVLAMKNTKTGEIEFKRIYKKQVDYNAQRLARTLAQHGYQQSFIATTQKNPFITEYVWHSNGSRVCDLCKARDGKHYKKTELPMDHPNGMCIMEPVVVKDMVDQLADWFNSPDGTYPEIDAFAGNFGYEAKSVKSPLDFVNKYGMSTKSPNAWYNGLTQIQKAEAKALKDASGLNWNDWYEKHVHSTGDATQDFIKKYGTSTKSPNAWFNSLSLAQKAEAKLLKEQSGLNWNDWYMKNVHAGSGSVATSAAKKATTKTVQAFNSAQDKYLKPYGYSTSNMPKNFSEWSHKLSSDQATEILKSMGTDWSDPHPYQKLMKYYDANLASSNFVSKAVSKADDVVKAAAKVASKADDVVKATTKAATTKTATKVASKIDNAGSTVKASTIDNYVYMANNGNSKAFTSLYEIFEKHGFDLEDLLDEHDKIDTESFMFKEAVKKITGTASTTAKTTTTAAKTSGNISDYKTWLKSFNKQTESYMLNKERKWMSLIGEAGQQGIRQYSGSSYHEMNGYLRYLQQGFSEEDAIRKSGISSGQLRSVKAAINGLNKVKLDEDFVLRRGSSIGDIAGLFMQGDYRDNKRVLRSKTTEELNDMFQGAVGSFGSFTSTSSIWDRGFSEDVEYIIYAPKGTSASSIMSISNFGTGEGETLLNAGTTVRCVKIEDSDGHMRSSIRVFLEVIVK